MKNRFCENVLMCLKDSREWQKSKTSYKFMAKITGRFYLKKTSNGNLLGEWSNDHSGEKVSTESCDLIAGSLDFSENAKGSHAADYYSTWQENGNAVLAQLKISQNNRLFSLDWQCKPPAHFEGQGMLCDDILIGDYHQV